MIGTTISHYKILEKVGEGGMGIVYKAQDTNLDRFVALKFLPERLSNSEQDRARFLQEAKAASALNHPNICTIYGIEEHNGQLFIVMELVDGQTLSEKKNSITFKQALDIGIQLAEGLAVAHEKGIVHRDIKPDNIMVRKDGIVQIMDFGLAKLRGVSKLTKEGSTIGTAGYMSPEQVQGQDADHRSDIFSYGVLLYELFTGQLPFRGVHESALMYEIVNSDAPPMSSVKPEISAELDSIVLECLEKDPNERTQSVKQISIDLRRSKRESTKQRVSRIINTPSISSSTRTFPTQIQGSPESLLDKKWPMAGAAGALCLILGLVFGVFAFGSKGKQEVLRASIELSRGMEYNSFAGGNLAISPDGQWITFAANDSTNESSLWVRPLNTTAITKLTGTRGATYPFWSPDSRSIAFFADGKLKRIDAAGGPVVSIADAPQGRGGAWGLNGTIIFSPNVEEPNLFHVSAAGGSAEKCTDYDSSTGFVPRFPSFLPDGDRYLVTLYNLKDSKRDPESRAGSLSDKKDKLLISGVSNMMYAAGYVVYLRQSILMIQQFDDGALELKGHPTAVQENVNFWSARAKGDFSISGNGRLIYHNAPLEKKDQLIWADRGGRQSSIFDLSALSAVISSSGNEIVFDEFDRTRPGWDAWKYDLKRQVKTRFTFSKDLDYTRFPIWSADGSHIFYTYSKGALRSWIMMKKADGSGIEESIVDVEDVLRATDISPEGRYLLLTRNVQKTGKAQIAFVDIKSDRKLIPILTSEYNVRQARFSPDGRWIVYLSDESGKNEVYIQPFREEGAKYQISSRGGANARWRGNEIFFESDNKMWVAQVSISGKVPTFGSPKELFNSGEIDIFDVSRDGKNFLCGRSPAGGSVDFISLIDNWENLAKKK